MPHELKDRQMESQQTICEILLQRHDRRSLLHLTVADDEQFIYIQNPKGKKSQTMLSVQRCYTKASKT